jgi:hypothetical protein
MHRRGLFSLEPAPKEIDLDLKIHWTLFYCQDHSAVRQIELGLTWPIEMPSGWIWLVVSVPSYMYHDCAFSNRFWITDTCKHIRE